MPPTAPKFSGPKLEGHIDTVVRDGPGPFAQVTSTEFYHDGLGWRSAPTVLTLDEAHFLLLLNTVAKTAHPTPTIEPGRKPNDPWYNQHRRNKR